METANGKTTESAMPAENRYGYREGHTGMPQRRIEEMKRKTFVKQLMALGVKRNDANKLCRIYIEGRDARRAAGGKEVRVAWEYVLAGVLHDYETCYELELPIRPTETEMAQYRRWRAKRTKIDPMHSWLRNHPNNI